MYVESAVENYILEVLPPHKECWIPFNTLKNFSLTLNSSNLQYKKAFCEDDLIDLPDGIYEFKQSYKPNIHTLKHYYHFRTVSLENKLRKAFSDLFDEKCDINKDEFFRNREKLRDIKEYLEASKYMVEECLEKQKGKELYSYSKQLLKEYSKNCYC